VLEGGEAQGGADLGSRRRLRVALSAVMITAPTSRAKWSRVVPSPIAGEAARPLALQRWGWPYATFVQTSCQRGRGRLRAIHACRPESRVPDGGEGGRHKIAEAVAGKVAASSYLRLEFAVSDAQLSTLGFLVWVVVRRHGSSTGWPGWQRAPRSGRFL